MLGVRFEIVSADADESSDITDPALLVRELALRKGRAVRELLLREGRFDDNTLIIASDTVVATEYEILGKPTDREDAVRMLRQLSGGTHQVVTGIGITVGGVTTVASEVTLVHVDRIPDEEILAYVATGDPMDKAGSYGIQGEFSRWIKGISGCYFNVVGLPVNALNRLFFEITGEYLK